MLHRVTSTDEFARFELAEDITDHHHHHLICSACGDVADFTVSEHLEAALEEAMREVADGTGLHARAPPSRSARSVPAGAVRSGRLVPVARHRCHILGAAGVAPVRGPRRARPGDGGGARRLVARREAIPRVSRWQRSLENPAGKPPLKDDPLRWRCGPVGGGGGWHPTHPRGGRNERHPRPPGVWGAGVAVEIGHHVGHPLSTQPLNDAERVVAAGAYESTHALTARMRTRTTCVVVVNVDRTATSLRDGEPLAAQVTASDHDQTHGLVGVEPVVMDRATVLGPAVMADAAIEVAQVWPYPFYLVLIPAVRRIAHFAGCLDLFTRALDLSNASLGPVFVAVAGALGPAPVTVGAVAVGAKTSVVPSLTAWAAAPEPIARRGFVVRVLAIAGPVIP